MTTSNTSKIPTQGTVVNLPEGATQVNGMVDGEKIEQGELWILTKEGKLVSAKADPVAFDEAVTQHMTLLDRATWPLLHRVLILSSGSVPLFSIPREKLTSELAAQLGIQLVPTQDTEQVGEVEVS